MLDVNFSMKDEIEDWQFYHELGHGIIAFIFDGYIYDFKGITFDRSDVHKINLHSDDKGYTIIHPIQNYNDFVSNNNHNAALVDGLYILSGSAGATFLGVDGDFSNMIILPNNWEKIINTSGACGDFEIIKTAKSPFGWLMDGKGLTLKNRVFNYCKLYQILLYLFIKFEVVNKIPILFNTLKKCRRLSPQNFRDSFDNTLTNNLKLELLQRISIDEFGNIDGDN